MTIKCDKVSGYQSHKMCENCSVITSFTRMNCVYESRIWLSAVGQVLSKPQSDSGNSTLRNDVKLPFAVLDLHFTKFKKGIFAIATSKGTVCLCTMRIEGTGPVECLNSYQIFSKSSLTLSLAWNSVLSHSDTVAASSSDGRIAIFDTKNQPPMTYTKTEAHSLEAWTLTWTFKGAEDDVRPELFSGGDDSALCRHGLSVCPVSGSPDSGEIPPHAYDFQTPFRDTKTHMAGVTAIVQLLPVYDGHHVLVTGSYDEYVRVLMPIDGCSRPKFLAEKRLGGGVWRLNILDFQTPHHALGT